MGRMSWLEAMKVAIAQGTFHTTYTTAKSVINAGDLVTYPADFWTIGRALRIDVIGAISNIVTTPGTVTFNVKFGSVIVFTTGAIQLNATAHTKLPFWLEILMTCRAVGSGTSANFIGQAKMNGKIITNTAGQTDGANSDSMLLVPATAPAVGTGFDSTAAQQLDFHAGFSISDAANGIQIEQYLPVVLN